MNFEVELGQVWQVGSHRIMCGDSTNPEQVKQLVGEARIALTFTSPPYADMRTYGGTSLSTLRLASFIYPACRFSTLIAVNLGLKFKNWEVVPYWDTYIQTAKKAGLKLLAWNVWNRMLSGSVNQQHKMFPIEHEFVFVFGKKPVVPNRVVAKKGEKKYKTDKQGRMLTHKRKANGTIEASPLGQLYENKPIGSVISEYPELGTHRQNHPAVMGINLALRYLEAVTQPASGVYDPFLGSGTTIEACERLGRVGYGMEIHPPYCSVALERLAKLGLEVKLAEVLRNG
jgi:DNA modification methylase